MAGPVYIACDPDKIEEMELATLSGIEKDDKLKEFEEAKKREIHIRPERIPELLKGYDCVVVNDFGDGYHKSDEEKEKENKFYTAFKEFRRHKKIIRRASLYVDAMRSYFKCLDLVAQDNGAFPPDKFKLKVLQGKIHVAGLKFPVFKGREKKEMSLDYLVEFIFSDEDSRVLDKRYREDFLDTDDIPIDVLFTEEELEYYLSPCSDEENEFENKIFDVEEDSGIGKNIAVEVTNKEYKQFLKLVPGYSSVLKEIKDDRSAIDELDRFYGASSMISDDLSRIQEYDEKYSYKSSSDMPRFKGDVMSDDYYKYIRKLNEWEREHIKVNYNGKNRTLEEVNNIELLRTLDANGWNTRKLGEEGRKEDKLRKGWTKEDSKKEKDLKKKLSRIQDKKKKAKRRKLGDDFDKENINKKEKKSKKKKKKDKKKDTYHLHRKDDPERKKLVNTARKHVDDMVAAAFGYSSFEDVEDKVLDFRMFGGENDE